MRRFNGNSIQAFEYRLRMKYSDCVQAINKALMTDQLVRPPTTPTGEDEEDGNEREIARKKFDDDHVRYLIIQRIDYIHR